MKALPQNRDTPYYIHCQHILESNMQLIPLLSQKSSKLMFCQKSLKYVKIGQKKLYLKKKIHKNPHLKCQNAPFFIKKTYTHFERGAYESGA